MYDVDEKIAVAGFFSGIGALMLFWGVKSNLFQLKLKREVKKVV
jgi:hypothetical protein